MKVKFLKNHLDNKKGDIKEVEYQQGRYFINVGVAELASGESGESPAVKNVKSPAKETPAKKTTKKAPAKSKPKNIEDKSLKVDLEDK